MRRTRTAQWAALAWPSALLLLPVLVLAVLGERFLGQDRTLADKEARERCQLAAEDLAARCLAALTNAPAPRPDLGDSAAQVRADQPRRFAFFDTHGELSFPPGLPSPPTPPELDLAALSADARDLWEKGRASLSALEPARRIELWERFLKYSPPPAFAAIARFQLARAREVLGQPEALADYDLLRSQYPDALTESGLPLKPLATWRRAQIDRARADGPHFEDPPARSAWLEGFCQDLVAHPSLLSPTLLASAGSAADPPRSPSDPALWLEVWRHHETTRALAREESARWRHTLTDNASATPTLFWTPLDEPWLGIHFPLERRAEWLPLAEVRRLLQEQLDRAKGVPDYCSASVEIGPTLALGNRPPDAPRPDTLLGSALGPEPAGLLKATLWLVHPERLYARQRARARWFLGLISVAAAGSLVGLTATWRAQQRQQRLLRMKSDFVSSVTHELRAPLAAVRLMAESLERGKIPQADKRQEYFHFIVQECRRLSALIENVLDFARIEQGRKQYYPEPTDLTALIQQTAQLLEPYAAERQVRTVVELAPDLAPEAKAIHADGQALQRALINLLDNAIKHAPPNSAVTIGLDTSAGCCQLSVRDQGPGIPSEDHQRIFEQFYRRGSELRRETAGIGIGLTLVKHIVEAHRGTIRVESEVGKGSRFLLRLPIGNPQSSHVSHSDHRR